MKILEAISYLNTRFGGDVNVCANISRMLARNHHDVTIITTDLNFDPEYADMLRKEGITVIAFPVVVKYGLFLYTPSMNSWLEKNIREFDIIHNHNFRSYQTSQIHAHAVKYGIPYILQAHGTVIPFSEKQTLKKLYDIVWGKNILRHAVKVIALTGTESGQYQTMGVPRDKIVIIPNGVDPEKFDNLPEPGKFRKSHGIAEKSKIVLFVGRLHKTKGLDLLIDAFDEVSRIDPDASLLVIGPDYGYLPEMKRKIQALNLQEKVRILGFVTNEEKTEALVDADVFVTPSYYGFPVTFLEACACGTPLVITTDGDEFDWIGQVGYVTEHDSYSVKTAIIQILTDRELRKQFSRNGKKVIRERFNWDTIAKEVEALYRSSNPPGRTW